MPLHNVTIDDASALIAYYNPNGIPWKDSPSNDTLEGYWDSTYHSSNQSGAWSTFRFEGTAVYLFAATRWMHGRYDILMDNQQVYQGNGHTSTSIFNQLVFNATSLSPGWHNLTMLNTDPGLYIEVDYIVWTTVMSANLTERSGTPIPRTLGNMTYDASVWDENTLGSSPYMVTGTSGATVNITFQGNGIELYGRTGPQYGMFSARVDGYESHELNAYSGGVHNTLLFRQDNFTDGQHTLVVTNRGNASLGIASAIPILWSNGQDPPAASNRIHTGLIVGLALGLAIGLTMLVLLWVWFVRRDRTYHGLYADERSKVPTAYGPEYEATPFIYPLVHLGEQTSPHTLGNALVKRLRACAIPVIMLYQQAQEQARLYSNTILVPQV
ncbi:transmembrane protein, putative [Rhizoctonia solani AG-3 Rhs1AP]|uniref:Transmembrane protein, putative n=1 Tax=Rhizoctonia solani AG-3 Rhs1AP TaxID=1086054 RepID=X8J1G5_9AGAM|nr:transmembrane protein, putative [Rhizoctonia solani AG-3 Rhs1AP]